MGDHERGAPLHQALQPSMMLRSVWVSSALVGSSRMLHSALAHHGIVSILERENEIVGLRQSGGFQDFYLRDQYATVPQDSVLFSRSIAENIAYGRFQQNPAFGDVVEAGHQVRAIERGKSEKILSIQASLLARAHGLLPGLVPDLLGIVNRWMPSPTQDPDSVSSGAAAEDSASSLFRAFTALGRNAARKTNEMAAQPS